MSNPYGTYPSSPYQSPVGQPSIEGRVKPPAIGLIAISIVGFVGMTIYFVLTMVGIATGEASLPEAAGEAERIGQAIGYYGTIGCIGFNALIQLLILAAGICMFKQRNYMLCMVGAVTAGIPCLGSSCCVLGMPFGIWAFIILMNQDVKASFR